MISRDRQNWMPASCSKVKTLIRSFLSCAFFFSEHGVGYKNKNKNNNIVAESHRYGSCDWISAPPKL